MASPLPTPDFNLLLAQLCAGDLTSDQAASLTAQLESDDRACEAYVRYLNLHAELLWRCGGERLALDPTPPVLVAPIGCEPAPRESLAARSRKPLYIRLSALAASLLLVAYFVGMAVFVSLRHEKPQAEYVATVDHTQDVQWTAPPASEISNLKSQISNQQSEIRNQKSEITHGEPLEIASGLVELKLKQGVTLTVQGPAKWSIDGNNRATLLAGKVHAVVPPQAVGFLLNTPAAQIVDLGTEFTAEANSPSETTLQVIRGEVRIDDANRDSASASRHVSAGQACRIELATGGHSHIESIPFDAAPSAIPQIADTPIERWQKASQHLQADPSLVAYYDFEDHAYTSLPKDEKPRQSLLINARADKLHGQIASPTRDTSWTTGRWRDKRGLVLGPNFAYAEIPDAPALQWKDQGTIALWFRPDALPSHRYALMVAKGNLPQCNYSLWLTPTGQVRFFATQVDGATRICESTAPVAANRWHLAVGIVMAGEMRLYIDGVAACPPRKNDMALAANHEPLQLGRPVENNGWPVFVGVVDELAIFNRAQSPEEIAAMYEAGRPD